MKTLSFYIVLIATIYLTYGLIISQVKIRPETKTNQKILPTKTYDYKGVLNVHSQEGSGKGTVPEILKAAYDANLDFLVFTESTFANENTSKDRYEENLLVLHGREYTYLKSRILLIDPTFEYSQITSAGDAHLFLSDYLENNRQGYVVLKHPTKQGYEWEGEFASGLDAIEIISLRSQWRESWDLSKWNFISSLLMYPFNSEYAFLNIYQAPDKNLKLWNTIAENRKIVGLIGSDAKSKLKLFGDNFLRFPTYKQLFLLSSNHVVLNSELTGQLQGDSEKIMDAFKSGQLYFSLDFLGNPKGFNFFGKTKAGGTIVMGQDLNLKNSELCFTEPETLIPKTWAVLYHKGQKLKSFQKASCFKPKLSGRYNLIYYRKIQRPWPFKALTVPWIYSNFIYVK